jgi:hypothetical protein
MLLYAEGISKFFMLLNFTVKIHTLFLAEEYKL